MSRPRYEDDDKLMQDVRSCMQKPLSTDETITELRSKGREISKKQLQRIKRRIRKIQKDKVKNMTTNGILFYVFEAIDTLCEIKGNLMELAKNTEEDPWVRINAYANAAKVTSQLSKFYESGPELAESFKQKQ